jgi:ankyrin repeat protein
VIRASWVFAVMAIGCAAAFAWPVHAASFPAVDRDKLRITLSRTQCFGECPAYQVTVDGHGHVVFTTDSQTWEDVDLEPTADPKFAAPFVVAPGRHEADVDPKDVDALVERFRSAGFFELKDEYRLPVSDAPTYTLEVDTGDGVKRVTDYHGYEAGMPPAVGELEAAVDKVAGTARWVDGADGLIELLEREGFDFRSEAAAHMLLGAANDGSDETIRQLLKRGALLSRTFRGTSYGQSALLAAVYGGRASLLTALVARGWLKRVDRKVIARAFAMSGGGCSPDLVDAAVAAGVAVDSTSAPSTADSTSDGKETALAAIAHNSYQCRQNKGDAVETAKRLLAHGASPNARDEEGETPIFEVDNLELLDLLLAHGADPHAVGKDGNSAVFGSWNDEIVLRLLQAGASPRGRSDGRTFLETARDHHMTKVEAWLKAHPDALGLSK